MSGGDAVITDPARVLARAANRSGSGILTATRGKQKRLICVTRGRLVFVASNVVEEQLERYLCIKGLVEVATLETIEPEARQTRQRAAMLLLHRGEISAEVLYEAAADRTRHLLASTIEWTDAQFQFSDGQPKLEGELTVDLPCLPLLYEHALRFPKTMPEVRERIGPPEMRPLRVEEVESVLEQIELDDSGRGVIEFSDGFLTATEVVSRVRGSAESAWRAIHALLVVGVLRAVARGEVPKTAVIDAVSRQEMLARLARDESDHYAVLGLTAKASADEVREAYYYLARRYHPDRHRTGELKDLLIKIEQFFTKVTEAYNTLIDPESRERYDEEITTATTSTTAEPQQDARYLARQNFARGKLLLEKKQYHDALRFFENAIELDSSKAEYHLELGYVLHLNPRRRDDAERRLKKAVEMNPGLTRAYLTLGELYERAERTEEAVEMFEEVLRWEASNAKASAGLARVGPAVRGKRKKLFRS
jgi:tetratricopeptide (TPR) repeat protein